MFGKKHTSKKKRGSAGLNMAIASMHGLNNRLIGLQMTSGNVIGIVVSAIQVTIGALIVAHPSVQFGIILAVVTCALAVLIERLSLGGLGNVRNAVAKWTQLDDAYFEMQQVEQREPTALETHNYQRKRSIQVWTFIGSLLIVLVGVSISGFVGDQFWEWVWHSAGAPLNTILGIACAVVISLGFVYSELFKKPSDDEIEDRVNDDRIQQAVLKRAETDLQIGLGLEAFGNVRADADKKQQALLRIEEVVQDRLVLFADQMSTFGRSNMLAEQPTLIDAPVDVPLLSERAEENHAAQPEPVEENHAAQPEPVEENHAAPLEQAEESHAALPEPVEESHAAQPEPVEESHAAPPKPTVIRSYYAQYRDVLIDALTKNPTMSLKELGELTNGCPTTTLRRWKARIEKEQSHAAPLEQVEESHAAPLGQAEESHAAPLEQVEESHAAPLGQAEESHAAPLEQVEESHAAQPEPTEESHAAPLEQVEADEECHAA